MIINTCYKQQTITETKSPIIIYSHLLLIYIKTLQNHYISTINVKYKIAGQIHTQ